MRKVPLIVLLAAVFLSTGCIIYFVDQPSKASVGSTIEIEMVLEADQAASGAETPIACIGFPASWGTVLSVAFEASIHGTTDVSGIGVPAPTQTAQMNAGYSFTTNGELAAWQCFAGMNADYGNDSYGTATFRVNVGSSGMFTLQYSAGSVGYGPAHSLAARSLGVGTSPDDLDKWYVSSLEPVSNRHLYSIGHGAGRFVAAGYDSGEGINVALSSTNGKSWSLTSMSTVFDVSSINYGSDRYIMLGDNGELFLSPDGLSWVDTSSVGMSVYGAVYGIDQFVAVGGGGLAAVSSDGAVWATNQATPSSSDVFFGIAYGGGKYSAVGFNFDSNNAISYGSTNGTTWSGTPLSSIHDRLTDVAYGNGRFVAVGQFGRIIWSTSGQGSWINVDSGTDEYLTGITYDNGHFVAVGYSGTILTSTDGASWTKRNSGTSVDLYDVTGGDGGFVAVGDYGVIVRQGLATGSGGGGGGGCATVGEIPAGPPWPGLLAVVLMAMVLVGMRRKVQYQD